MKLSYAKNSLKSYWNMRHKYFKMDNSWCMTELCVWFLKTFDNTFSLPNIPTLVSEHEDHTEYFIKPSRMVSNMIRTERTIDSYLTYLNETGAISGYAVADNKPNKYGLKLETFNNIHHKSAETMLGVLNTNAERPTPTKQYLEVSIGAVYDYLPYSLYSEMVIDDFKENFGFFPKLSSNKGDEYIFSDTGLPILPEMLHTIYTMRFLGINLPREAAICSYRPWIWDNICDKYEEYKSQIEETKHEPEVGLDWSSLRREYKIRREFYTAWLKASNRYLYEFADDEEEINWERQGNLLTHDFQIEETECNNIDDYTWEFVTNRSLGKKPKMNEKVIAYAHYVDLIHNPINKEYTEVEARSGIYDREYIHPFENFFDLIKDEIQVNTLPEWLRDKLGISTVDEDSGSDYGMADFEDFG